MTPPKAHPHRLRDAHDAEDWIEERPASQLAPNAYQRREQALAEAEDHFFEDLAKLAENEDSLS